MCIKMCGDRMEECSSSRFIPPSLLNSSIGQMVWGQRGKTESKSEREQRMQRTKGKWREEMQPEGLEGKF